MSLFRRSRLPICSRAVVALGKATGTKLFSSSPLLYCSRSLSSVVTSATVDDTPRQPFHVHLPPVEAGQKRIYLIRHGETDWNAQHKMQGGGFDIPLNENGHQQAKRVAQELSQIPLDVIVSSHLSRAIQTADAIAAAQPLPPKTATTALRRLTTPNFGEMRFGRFEGHARAGPYATPGLRQFFEEHNEAMYEDVDLPWPEGGESIRDVEFRVQRGMMDLLLQDVPGISTGTPTHICIVGHGRLNKILLTMFLNGDARQDIAEYNQGNSCINVMDVDLTTRPAKWLGRLFNFTEHMENSNQMPS